MHAGWVHIDDGRQVYDQPPGYDSRQVLELMKRGEPLQCPDGLQPLVALDRVLVEQEVQLFEEVGKLEIANKYKVKSPDGKLLYTMIEETDMCTRNCCGTARAWTFHMLDTHERDVMTMRRSYRSQNCCCPCLLQKCKIEFPTETTNKPTAKVKQNWSPGRPRLTIYLDKQQCAIIKGPMCTNACIGGNVVFDVLSFDGKHVIGRIEKRWAGVAQEALTKADNFALYFPVDLQVKCKAALIAANILIDFMYYEEKPKGKHAEKIKDVKLTA